MGGMCGLQTITGHPLEFSPRLGYRTWRESRTSGKPLVRRERSAYWSDES